MVARPTLKTAIAGTKNKASDYNDNFDLLLDYIDDVGSESKTYVEGFMPTQTGNGGKFLTTNGATASWSVLVAPGTVAHYGGNSAPSGWLLCDGSAVSRTTYANLYNAIGTKYGTGNGSTTFNLPNLINKYIKGSSTSGTNLSAGLPNLTFDASFGGNGAYVSSVTNMTKSGTGKMTSATGNYGQSKISFDASNVSSIYGASDTVQPPSLTMLPIIKY